MTRNHTNNRWGLHGQNHMPGAQGPTHKMSDFSLNIIYDVHVSCQHYNRERSPKSEYKTEKIFAGDVTFGPAPAHPCPCQHINL